MKVTGGHRARSQNIPIYPNLVPTTKTKRESQNKTHKKLCQREVCEAAISSLTQWGCDHKTFLSCTGDFSQDTICMRMVTICPKLLNVVNGEYLHKLMGTIGCPKVIVCIHINLWSQNQTHKLIRGMTFCRDVARGANGACSLDAKCHVG